MFDADLLARLSLSGKRLVFIADRLAELGAERGVDVHLGDPVTEIGDRPVATTFAPVPGWRRRAARIAPVEVHPWPWLERPGAGPIGSFSAWMKRR